MILIVTNTYPSADSLYENAFVHRRAVLYKSRGCQVAVVCPAKRECMYEHEGIFVFKGSVDYVLSTFDMTQVKAIFVHFLTLDVYRFIEALCIDCNVVRNVWIHGFEAEAWHRRHFIFTASPIDFFNVARNKINFNDNQLAMFKNLFASEDSNYNFIHVSKWFKEKIVECDVGAQTPNYTVIPNPIDSGIFRYKEKNIDQRFKVLILRPFSSTKYANDISVAAIQLLSKHEIFHNIQFLICGDGIYYDEITGPLKRFNNVRLRKGFLTQSEIAALHQEHGIFLCPTRWDSQGVSMCEAISSGMVAISSDVSAIPEFVINGVSGLLAKENTPEQFCQLILNVVQNPNIFSEISRNGHLLINNMCGSDMIISRELSLIGAPIKRENPKIFPVEYWMDRYRELEDSYLEAIDKISDTKFLIKALKYILLRKLKSIIS